MNSCEAISAGFRVGADDTLGRRVPVETPSCPSSPSERVAGRVLSLPAGQSGVARAERGQPAPPPRDRLAGPFSMRGRSVVDQEPHKLRVPGSIPGPATTFKDRGARLRAWLAVLGRLFELKRERRGQSLGRLLANGNSIRRIA